MALDLARGGDQRWQSSGKARRTTRKRTPSATWRAGCRKVQMDIKKVDFMNVEIRPPNQGQQSLIMSIAGFGRAGTGTAVNVGRNAKISSVQKQLAKACHPA